MIDAFLRDAQGDTVSFVSPYKVRTVLQINTKIIPSVFIQNILDWFVFHHMLACHCSNTIKVTVLWDVMQYSLVDKLTFWRNLLFDSSG
jgi:hypothetical protein